MCFPHRDVSVGEQESKLQAAMMNRELIAYKLVKIMLKLQSSILMHRAESF